MAAGQVKLPYAPADIKSREDFGEMVVRALMEWPFEVIQITGQIFQEVKSVGCSSNRHRESPTLGSPQPS